MSAWLADVLARIAEHPVHGLDDLLPWNWQKTTDPRKAAAPAFGDLGSKGSQRIPVGWDCMVDMYGTPHTEALHVVERYRLLDYESAKESEDRGESENFRLQVSDTGLARNPNDKGPGLLLEFTVEDPGVFTTPWSARITYRRPLGSWPEFVCAESTRDYVGRTINLPHADKPDF